MARYIDADALIEMLNNKAKTDLEMGLYNHGALTQSFIKFVERQPTADVAPKSEVERLEHLRADLSKEVDRLKDDNKFLQDRRFKEWSEVRQEVAREIFEKIEELAIYGTTHLGLCLMSIGVASFAELKKKYTEEE